MGFYLQRGRGCCHASCCKFETHRMNPWRPTHNPRKKRSNLYNKLLRIDLVSKPVLLTLPYTGSDQLALPIVTFFSYIPVYQSSLLIDQLRQTIFSLFPPFLFHLHKPDNEAYNHRVGYWRVCHGHGHGITYCLRGCFRHGPYCHPWCSQRRYQSSYSPRAKPIDAKGNTGSETCTIIAEGYQSTSCETPSTATGRSQGTDCQ